nr:MAG TPA: hypothetical protein [Caudoviricetes sp.]
MQSLHISGDLAQITLPFSNFIFNFNFLFIHTSPMHSTIKAHTIICMCLPKSIYFLSYLI